MNSGVRCIALALALGAAQPAAGQSAEEKDNIAGPYVPTPWVIVDEMLKLADIRGDDVVYDLGSGDGRLVIAAAKRFGARGVGVELQTELVEMARIGAKREAVADRVKFVQGDLFEADIKDASVVMLYLLPRFTTRLVSHDYPLAPWPPDKELSMDVPEKEMISGTAWTRLFYYVVPARVQGVWELSLPPTLAGGPLTLNIAQAPDSLSGTAKDAKEVLPLRDLAVRGVSVRFGLLYQGRLIALEGKVDGQTMAGEARTRGVREPWTARYRGPIPR